MKFKSILMLTVTLLIFATGCATNPISGKQQLMLMSEDQDVEIGKKYAPEIEKQLGGRVQNLQLQNYVEMVGQRVARVSDNTSFDYTFVALEDEMVNAFALPGGPVFITKGMLLKLDSESQLASILAHETAHIVARHSSAQMSRQIGISLILSAASTQTSSTAAMKLADVAAQIVSLSYSRTQEKEADLGGLKYMTNAGYDPQGMIQTFEMLMAEDSARPLEFFSTHPNPENRIGYLQQAISVNQYYPGTNFKVGTEDYKRFVLDNLNIE